MASLDHAPLVHAYQALFDVTRDDLEDIAKHLTKAKGQGIIDILGQITELLQRIQTASSPTKLEIEVARAIARDFDTIAKRWNELEQYFVNEIQYDDYVYRSDEDRAIAAEKAQRIIQEQALQALDAAGAMFGVAREWRRAATCFETVVQARKAKETPLLALPAIIRAYRCYEELSDASKVLSTGQEIQKLLTTVTGEISSQDQAMLQEAAEFFRKTAMAAVTNRKKDPDLNIPLASIFLWNEAETLNLITPADDDTALSRFRALAEFFEQVGKEELAKPTPSLQRFIASYMEGTFANLRITRNISGFTIKEAQQQALQLTQYATDFILTLIERLGYHRVRIVQDPSKAMKGLIATFELIQRGYKGSKAFQDLAKQAGVTLVQAQQRADQILIDLATVFRWLCEGSSGALYVISMKLITDIYRVAIISDVLDVGSKEELRKRILDLLGLAEEDELFGLLIDTEVEFDDVVDLFKSLDLYWVSAICKLNQGQLRQNLTFLEVEMASPVSSEQEIVGIPEDEQKLDAMPFWGAAPSIDFTTAADLYSRAFRLKRGADESFPTEGIDNWIPHRDPEDLKRRAAYSHWLAGLANLEEGNIEDGGRQLFLAKNSYELLDRHREAILCLEIWMRQLVVTIRPEEGGGARPTQARLEELLNVCDELVGLYALRQTTPETIDDILNIIRFLQNEVGLENWTLSVYLRTIEYSREAHSIALQLGTPEEALEMLRFLREELSAFLGSDFAIGVYPNFDTEATIYFEAETPVKLAILNISEQEAIDLTIRPVGILPHLSPNPSQPWQASRDPSQITMKHFYIGSDDDAFTIDDLNYPYKPADAFGPSRPIPVSLEPTPDSLIEVESTLERAGEQPWLGVMWSGDYNGTTIGTLAGVTEEPPSKDTPRPPIDDLKQAAFFTVFTKSAREGNILPGQIFPVTFGIYSRGSSEPIAIQTIYFKIASRPKILKAQTQWTTDLEDEWEESFGIRFEEGAHLPMYAPRFAPEYESKDYVTPQTLTPTITIGSEAVDLTKYLKHVPYHFNLRYKGKRTLHSGNNYLVKSDISLEMPYAGQIEGNYEFLRIRTPPRIMTAEELAMPRLRNGVNFQELFYGTVFIGDADFDGEYYVYRLWICFEPGEKTPAPGASYRQGWTNHRLDIFLDPKNWEPRLLITDYYVEFEDGRGEWVEALFTFKAASSTWFGIRRLTADLYREAKLKDYPDPFESEIRHALQPVGVTEDTPLKITGFALGQRLGFIELIRAVWARNKNDGPVIFKPPRAHLFRDYWSQRYEHGLYREDWYGGPDVNLYEMKYNDRSGGQSKYIRGFKKRDFPHEVSIKAREGDRCDLFITPPVESAESMIIRNVINPRKIELWTRPHVSFSRRFNFIAKYFGRPPKIHTASLYFYSTRRELNPYYKGRVRGKDQWIQYPEAKFWDGRQWTPIPEHFDPSLHPENLSYGINSWLEADAYWVYRYVWYWPLEFTFPLPHDDWERADIWVNARTGKIEWITSDYHWRELWYQNAVKVSGVNPIIDFLFNWNTPEPLTVKDGAQVHQSIVPYFKEGKTVGEFADQLPWMFARYKQSCEHLHHLHQTWAGRNKVKIVYGGIFLLIFFLLSVWFFFFHPLGISWNPFWPPP